jgi:hypothetical protein
MVAIANTTSGENSGVIAAQWPTLSRAMSRYDEKTAETFSRMAYDAVENGLIRLECRQQLAGAAAEMGIREFDAQLLIACAVRRWAMERRYSPAPSRRAPALSYEHRSWRRAWTRVAMIMTTAVIIDSIILWKWLG